MKLPKACLNQIQKLQRNFIWGDNESGSKHHAIGWDDITRSKQEGGLGLQMLDDMVQNWDRLDDYCIWHIGDKKWVRVQKDNWIKEGINIEELQLNIPTQIQDACVADICLDNKAWNWDILMDWHPEDIIQMIQGIPP